MELERFQMVFLQMIPFLLAIVFHEFGHAFVAKKHGDTTAHDLGRLTLNPIAHIDPIGTLLFPMINMFTGIPLLFGWARPVPINYNRLRPYRRGLLLVAMAGPVANFLLALLSALALVSITVFMPHDFYLYEPFSGMAQVAISINFALGIFNLIPLPPLDGSKVIEAFLSYEQTKKFERLQSYSFFILLALLWSGGLNVLSVPVHFLTQASISIWIFLFEKLGWMLL